MTITDLLISLAVCVFLFSFGLGFDIFGVQVGGTLLFLVVGAYALEKAIGPIVIYRFKQKSKSNFYQGAKECARRRKQNY